MIGSKIMAFYMNVSIKGLCGGQYDYGRHIKTIEKIINGLTFIFDIHEISIDGYIINNEKPDVRFPARNTWSGWTEIWNCYYFPFEAGLGEIEKKFRENGFTSLKECEDYIEEIEKELGEFYNKGNKRRE